MDESVNALIESMRAEGPAKFSQWDADAFESYVVGPLATLHRMIGWYDKEQPDGMAVQNYLRLVFEGVGTGLLGMVVEEDMVHRNLLSCLLSEVVPYKLTDLDQSERAEFLRQVWNIGEGLAREPMWLNQFAIAKTSHQLDPRNLTEHFTEIFEPVLSTQEPATWDGTMQLHELSLQSWFPTFVPGRLYLCSPSVVCIEDRVNPPMTVAVFLRKGHEPEILGQVGELPEFIDPFETPTIKSKPDRIVINEQAVATPLLQFPRESLCVRNGFVIVTADDSQKLWFIEAA